MNRPEMAKSAPTSPPSSPFLRAIFGITSRRGDRRSGRLALGEAHESAESEPAGEGANKREPPSEYEILA